MMTTFHDNFFPEIIVSFTKGAPDIIISRCNSILINGETIPPLTDEIRKDLLNQNTRFSKSALRVLGLPIKNIMKCQVKFSKI